MADERGVVGTLILVILYTSMFPGLVTKSPTLNFCGAVKCSMYNTGSCREYLAYTMNTLKYE